MYVIPKRFDLGDYLVVLLVALVLVAMFGCSSYAPQPFSCSTPTDRERCELERRVYELEEAQRNRAHRDRARQSCEFAHGAGSTLCSIY